MSQNTTDDQLITLRLTRTQVLRLADICNTAATSPLITPNVAQRCRDLAIALKARVMVAVAQLHLDRATQDLESTGPQAKGAS